MGNLRKMLFPKYDQDGNILYRPGPSGTLEPVMELRDFKQVVYQEVIPIVGGEQKHDVYVNANANALVTYARQGKNLLESGEGQILHDWILPLSQSGPFNPDADPTTLVTLQANDYMDLLVNMYIRYFKNNEPIDESAGINQSPLPAIRWVGNNAAPTDLALQPQNYGATTERESNKIGNYFKNPPLFIPDNQIFRKECTYRTAIPASLANYRLAHYVTCNVFPATSQQLPRM